MITEEAKENQKKKQIDGGIQLCEEAIAKAEKYERLKDNKDWQGYLDDLKILAGLHEREIRMGISMILEAPETGYIKKDDFGKDTYISSKRDWIHFIERHEIQRQEAETWTKEPERVMALAAMAREKLPVLKEKLAELAAGVNGTK